MASFNFLGPVMKVQLESSTGKVLDFKNWSPTYSAAASDFIPVRAPGSSLLGGKNFPYLERVSVKVTGVGEATGGGRSSISNEINMSLTPPFELWRRLMDDYLDVFVDGTLLRVQLGYSGKDTGVLTEEFSGFLRSTTVDLGPDFVSMQLQATGSTWYMSRREGSINTDGRTTLEVLQEIVGSHGAGLFYLGGSGEELPLGATAPGSLSSLNDTLKEVEQDTDFAIVKTLILTYSRLYFYMRGARVVIYSRKQQGQSGFVPTFEYRGKPRLSEGVFPIISFSNSETQGAIKRASQAVASQDMDLDSGKDVKTVVKKNDPGLDLVFHRPFGVADEGLGGLAGAVAALGVGPSVDLAVAGLRAGSMTDPGNAFTNPRSDSVGVNAPVASNDPSGERKLQALKQRGEGMSGLQATWQTFGNPELRPGMPSNVTGVSKLFSGRYEIVSLTHTGDLTGYFTEIEGKTLGRYRVEAAGTEMVEGAPTVPDSSTPRSVAEAAGSQLKKVVEG